MAKKKLTKAKAKQILREGVVRGKRLTAKQKGFFGSRAGGQPIRPTRRRRRSK